MISLLARGVVQGLMVWGVYQATMGTAGLVAFCFFASDLWAGVGGMPAARAGVPGAILAALAFLQFPQTWVTLAYVAGMPVLGVVFGKKAAVATALSRVASGRVAEAAGWLTERAFPACERLAATPGRATVRAASQAILASIESGARGWLTRWFLKRLVHTLRVPQLCVATEFLTQARERPAEARAAMQTMLQTRLAAWTEVSPFRALWISLAVLITVTVAHPYWIDVVRM